MYYYVVIEELESEQIDANFVFDSYEKAREYVEKVINERNDLFNDDDDVVIFDNDDVYYIRKVKLVRGDFEDCEEEYYEETLS
jgi:hypothetical protein